jgi:cysteine synthase
MARDQLLNRPCGGRFGNVVESIGNTPLVELPRFSPKPEVRIYAKLEGHNPTGSVKDRVAKSMIEAAEAEGAIEPGQTILEPTSGNTGIALAMICRRKGYPLKVVMPDNVTEERTQLLKMYGAEIVYSEGAKGSNGAVEVALEMSEDPGFYMPYQYGNEANPGAHYNGTAVEILDELDGVAAFVGGLGTGGTLMGNGRRLKEADPETLIVAAEPMQGELVDGLRSLFAGVSAGAIARIAVRIAGEIDGGNVVFLIPDDGWKYLSSGVYTKPIEEIENLDSTVWW